MNGHPAIAYTVALQMLEEKRDEARRHHKAKTVARPRSLRLGRYRLTLTREVPGVPRTV
jgi:hypothetical protein